MFLKILQFLQFLFSAKKVIPAAADPVEPIEETVEIEEEANPMEDLKEVVLSKEFMDEVKKQVFPFTPIKNIYDNWPLIVEALDKKCLLDKEFTAYCLATISVENSKFRPTSEQPSKFSTKSGLPPYDFSKYNNRLGNGPSEGAVFKGRGVLQITFRSNYERMDKALGLDGGLINNPDAANEPHISAYIMVQYMLDRLPRIQKAFKNNDFVELRKIVNGGTLHLDEFKAAYLKVERIFQ